MAAWPASHLTVLLTLTQLSRNSDGSSATVIEANTGLTYYELNGRAGQYTVRFGHDNIVPIDSSIFRIDLDNSPAELAVTHGSVHVSDNQDLSADVHTNQTVRFDAQNPDEYQLLQSVSANTWDQWNSDRDQALAELDDTATAARASTGNPDNPAWSDLDANGDWYNVPGYGNGVGSLGSGPGLGSLWSWIMGLLQRHWIHMDFGLLVGMVALSLRRMELVRRLWMDVVSGQLRMGRNRHWRRMVSVRNNLEGAAGL